MTDESPSIRRTDQKLRQIMLIAIIAIAFTAIWLETYTLLHRVLWMNEVVLANRWTIPAGVLLFSLLVGLCLKYLHAPDMINGGFSESIKGEGSHGDYRTFPGTLLTSFFSLFSGASVGPEGSVAVLVMEISSWCREKLAVAEKSALGFDVAALASAYNGILGSPLFTAVLATEFNIGKKDALTFLAWNLIAGVIGYLFYTLLGLQSFASFLRFPSVGDVTPPLYTLGDSARYPWSRNRNLYGSGNERYWYTDGPDIQGQDNHPHTQCGGHHCRCLLSHPRPHVLR
jgi:H+/Cl- antiporter ClcA